MIALSANPPADIQVPDVPIENPQIACFLACGSRKFRVFLSCGSSVASVGAPRLPVPINARLDQLVELAEQAGERTSRKEIVGVCIMGSPSNADELIRRIRLYRRTPANGVYTSGPILVDALELQPARPGPRRRQWRQQTPPT